MTAISNEPTIIIAAENEAIRGTLRTRLSRIFPSWICLEAATSSGVGVLASRTKCALTVLVPDLPGGSERTVMRLVSASPGTAIIIASHAPTTESAVRFYALGAAAYAPLETPEVETAMRTLISGRGYFTPGVTPGMVFEEKNRRPSPSELSLREEQVLAVLASGARNPVIAKRLQLSLGTIKWHLNTLYKKFECRRKELEHLAASYWYHFGPSTLEVLDTIRSVSTLSSEDHGITVLNTSAVSAELGLSLREAEALQLLHRDLSNAEIAMALGLKISNVEQILKRLFIKMRVRNRVDAALAFKRHARNSQHIKDCTNS